MYKDNLMALILVCIGLSIIVCGYAIYTKSKKKDYDLGFVKFSYLIYNIGGAASSWEQFCTYLYTIIKCTPPYIV